MFGSRILTVAVLVITAVMLQVTVINRLGLPATRPDLLLVVVVGIALATGRTVGTVSGFCAGFLADLIPPANHPLGVLALIYAVVGYLAGRLEDAEETSVLTPLIAVAVLSVAALLGFGALTSVAGEMHVHWGVVARQLPLFALYDVILVPFVVPPVAWLARRVSPEVDRT